MINWIPDLFGIALDSHLNTVRRLIVVMTLTRPTTYHCINISTPRIVVMNWFTRVDPVKKEGQAKASVKKFQGHVDDG